MNGRQTLFVIQAVEAGNATMIQADALAAVAAKGLIARQDIQSGKRGRPVRNYVLTPKATGFKVLATKWKG